MKITYTPNPLATIVELDDHEKEVLRLKLKIEVYEDMIFSAHWNLTRTAEYLAGLPRPSTIEKAREEAIEELDPDYWCSDEGSKLDARVEELLSHYLEELKLEHVGDCTCFPMSCSKCHAESMIGVDTIKGLGKHAGYRIQSVFSRWNQETQKHDRPEVSLAEALKKLEGVESKGAYEYLLAYQQEHFGGAE